HAGDRAANGDSCAELACRFDIPAELGRHARQHKPLAPGVDEVVVATFQEGKELGLRSDPFWNEQVHDRRVLGDYITGGPCIHSRDEAIGTRLDDGDVALVEPNGADRIYTRRKGASLNTCESDSEVLDEGRVDFDTSGRVILAFIGVPGHQ